MNRLNDLYADVIILATLAWLFWKLRGQAKLFFTPSIFKSWENDLKKVGAVTTLFILVISFPIVPTLSNGLPTQLPQAQRTREPSEKSLPTRVPGLPTDFVLPTLQLATPAATRATPESKIDDAINPGVTVEASPAIEFFSDDEIDSPRKMRVRKSPNATETAVISSETVTLTVPGNPASDKAKPQNHVNKPDVPPGKEKDKDKSPNDAIVDVLEKTPSPPAIAPPPEPTSEPAPKSTPEPDKEKDKEKDRDREKKDKDKNKPKPKPTRDIRGV